MYRVVPCLLCAFLCICIVCVCARARAFLLVTVVFYLFIFLFLLIEREMKRAICMLKEQKVYSYFVSLWSVDGFIGNTQVC